MLRPSLPTFAALCLSATLGACASTRLESPRTRAPSQALLDSVQAVPSGTVTAAPLAPPARRERQPRRARRCPASRPMRRPTPPRSSPSRSCRRRPPPVVTSGRASVVGSWDARDATGGNCKVTLSSAPALDLYKASASGCPNKDLARVSAWDFRDGEVYLYQPGGTVAARLRQGGGALEGALTKSGASLALAR
ncbi:hypothetical protein FVA80_13365 [Methylobacterium sp. WL1]|nr:hypothetical protein FVA80_13365 [Methylobacterium sp. WL1]